MIIKLFTKQVLLMTPLAFHKVGRIVKIVNNVVAKFNASFYVSVCTSSPIEEIKNVSMSTDKQVY